MPTCPTLPRRETTMSLSPPTHTRALWNVAPGRVELRTEELATELPGNVLVETLYSGISRGTEALVFDGRVPRSEWQRMRAPRQQGEFPFPVKYGYANVGRVIGGSAARQGELVFSLTPHQERFWIPEHAVHTLPTQVPALRATLAANMETALNAIWDAGPLPGDRVSIVGGGVLGCLLASLLGRYPAMDVEVIDVLAERSLAVTALGARFRSPETATLGRDLVFHTSASSQGLSSALTLCRFAAKIVELSWYGDKPVELQLGGAFHSQRLQLIASQVGTVSPNKPGYSHAERLRLALRLLDDARLDTLFDAPIPFEECPTRLGSVFSGAPSASKPAQVIRYAS